MKKTRIAIEVSDFLEHSGFSAARLARESDVSPVRIHSLIKGKQKDILSSHADALREAMARLTSTPPEKEAPHA
jgi:hypothetical protein